MFFKSIRTQPVYQEYISNNLAHVLFIYLFFIQINSGIVSAQVWGLYNPCEVPGCGGGVD